MERYHVPQVSTGDILRYNVAQGTELGMAAKAVMARGELVSDDLVCEMVRLRLKQPDCKRGYVLDGFPRTASQAGWLDAVSYTHLVGDPSAAVVGHGAGKAKEVPQAIRKAIESAKKNLIKVNLTQTSIPHLILGRYGSGKVLLKPAPEGTGVIAGGAVRAVMTSVGIQNVLTKSIGTTNPHNVIKATFDALRHLKSRESVAAMRGKSVQEL